MEAAAPGTLDHIALIRQQHKHCEASNLYLCQICFLLHERDEAVVMGAKRNSEHLGYRRRLIIRFMWGMLAGTIFTSIILVSWVWWLDIGRHLF